MYKLICGANPVHLGIATPAGDWDLDALRDHSETCTSCRGLLRAAAHLAEYLTASQAAEEKGVSARTIQSACESGALPHMRPGREILIDRRDLQEWRPRPVGWQKGRKRK